MNKPSVVVAMVGTASAFGSSATPRRIFAPSEIFLCYTIPVRARDELIRPGAIGQGSTAAKELLGTGPDNSGDKSPR